MCPSDDSHLTLEFNDHYVISPTIHCSHADNFEINLLGEKGIPVETDFEYNSGTNGEWLDIDGLIKMLDPDLLPKNIYNQVEEFV